MKPSTLHSLSPTHMDNNHLNTFVQDLILSGCNAQVSTLQKVLCVLGDNAILSNILQKNENEDIYVLGGVKPTKLTRAGDDDITHKNYFFLDFDIRNDHMKRTGNDIADDAIRNLCPYVAEKLGGHELLQNWRYMVYTGNGIHVYYFGDTDAIRDKRWWSLGVNRLIDEAGKIVAIQPDIGCKNVSRISRLPGSFNNKNGRHVHVEIVSYQDKSFPISKIQQIGESEDHEAALPSPAAQKKPDVPTTMETINKIPIAPLVAESFSWNIHPDGRHFIDQQNGKKKACFVSEKGNFLVHGGTDHLPPSATGFSPFEFIRTVNSLDAAKTFDWFRAKFPHVAAVSAREFSQKKEGAFPFVDLGIMVNRATKYLDALDPNSIFGWGYAPLDDHLGGIYPSEVVMIGGESGTGKTSFLTSVLKHNARKHPVIFFSLEDTLKDYTLKQIWFAMGKIRKARGQKNFPWKEFRNNMLLNGYSHNDYVRDREEAERVVMADSNLAFYDRGHEEAPDKMDVATLVALIEKAVKRGYKLFGVDHLHFFNMEVKNSSKADRIEEIMQVIKNLADKHEISIILLAHYKKLMGEKPSIDSFKDSSAITQTANVVINMWRDRSEDELQNVADELSGQQSPKIYDTHFMMPKVRSPVGEKTIVMRFNPYTFEYEYLAENIGTQQELSRRQEIEKIKKPIEKPKGNPSMKNANDDFPF